MNHASWNLRFKFRVESFFISFGTLVRSDFRFLYAFFPFFYCFILFSVDDDDREPLDGDDVDGHNMGDEEDEEDGLFLRFVCGMLFYSDFQLVSIRWFWVSVAGLVVIVFVLFFNFLGEECIVPSIFRLPFVL